MVDLQMMDRDCLRLVIAEAIAEAEPGQEFDGKPDEIVDLGVHGVVEIWHTPIGVITAIELPGGLCQVLLP